MLVGLDDGDDAAAVRVRDDLAVLSTADFFTPVVDDAYDWGRIAAANALSDIYAMGGRPIVAINLVGWPRGVLPMELMTEVLRGGLASRSEAGCPVIGGHTIDDPEPKYGMAVTGVAHPDRLLRNDAAAPGSAADPHQADRRRAAQQPAQADRRGVRRRRSTLMTPLNRDAAAAALAAGVRGGHRRHRLRAARSPAQAVPGLRDRRRASTASAVPVVDGALEALRDGFVSGGTRRNLDWVRPHLTAGAGHHRGRPAAARRRPDLRRPAGRR